MQQHSEPFRTCERCSPQHKKVMALNGPVSWVEWRLHALCDCVGSVWVLWIPPTVADAVNVTVWIVVCLFVMALLYTGDPVRVCLGFCPITVGLQYLTPPPSSCSTELKRVDWRDGSKYYFREIKFWMRTLANKVQLLFINHCAFSYLGTSGPAHHHFNFFSVFLVFVCLFFKTFFFFTKS